MAFVDNWVVGGHKVLQVTHYTYYGLLIFDVILIFYLFICFQNKRGGRVKLQSIVMPLSEFDHADKGDALHG